VDPDDPLIGDADLLIVLGGPIGVYDVETFPFLAREIDWLELRLKYDRATLGICLGSQLMAKALGSRVFAGPAKEIGWGYVALTDAGRGSCLQPLSDPDVQVLHWHGDMFDLPDGATRLASTALYENQAFAFGRNALALQFHIEADAKGLEQWYVGHAVELAAAKISVAALRAATAKAGDRLQTEARLIFANWLGSIRPRAPAELTVG
jgi:GMP synthase (glutamine-hydrolysing)